MGIPILRIALGIVFFWFGALKVLNVSPVLDLVRATYPFMPYPEFFIFLGFWEVIIGLGLIFKFWLRATLALLWLQMFGTVLAPIFRPEIFFDGNIFLLSILGEFVVKNFVLIAASLVIGGYEVKFLSESKSP